MAEEVRKVPLKPIRAWEETRPPRRKSPRKSPQQQQELCVPQPFHADSPSPRNASCFMGPDSQEKETLDYINTFLKGNEQEEAKKLEFLDRVITISRAALTRHPEQNLAAFLCKALLVEKIKELIDLESVDSLTSGVRQQAMLAIMELSKVKPLLRGMELSSLLTVCFSSVFSLPPAETNPGVEAAPYNNTLNTMDELLKTLVCEDEKRNLVVLQNIVESPAPLDRIQGGASAAEGSGKNHLADQIHLRSTQIQVLKGFQQDSKSSVRCLALQTMLILKACKKHRPARASLRTLLHRMRLMHTRENPVIEVAQLPQ
ncbi:unnamed protein product [Lepidochelys kempii]